MAPAKDKAEIANPKELVVQETKDNMMEAAKAFEGSIDVGTEEMGADDVNMPNLKLIQSNTKNIQFKQEGWYFRTDSQEQIEKPIVNLVYVTTKESMNYNRTAMETQKVYFGFFDKTVEPFKMYVRGYGLRSHREFQSQLKVLKNRYHVPMMALRVELTGVLMTVPVKENGRETGKTNDIYVPKFTIVREGETQMPMVTGDLGHIKFLIESAERFRKVAAQTGAEESENDHAANNHQTNDPDAEAIGGYVVPPPTDSDIPF